MLTRKRERGGREMKMSLLHNHNNRRIAGYQSSQALSDSGAGDGTGKSLASRFWLLLHGLCCLISLILGFRFSRLVFFLLFSTTTLYTSTPVLRATTTTTHTETLTLSLPNPTPPPPLVVLLVPNRTRSWVVVERHGIRIHPMALLPRTSMTSPIASTSASLSTSFVSAASTPSPSVASTSPPAMSSPWSSPRPSSASSALPPSLPPPSSTSSAARARGSSCSSTLSRAVSSTGTERERRGMGEGTGGPHLPGRWRQ